MSSEVVSANPTKAFFVRMLTRDISLTDCLMDLVDNSIDAAWRDSDIASQHELKRDDALANYQVQLAFSDTSFTIRDNCGGIPLEVAKNYAFTFGRIGATNDYSIGVYGIGMKRAIFKLGNEINITSTYETETGTMQTYSIKINVESWMSQTSDSWDFVANSEDPRESSGLEIEVRELNPALAKLLADNTFATELRNTLARDYTMILARGLSLLVNEHAVRPWRIEFLRGDNFAPMRSSYQDNGVEIQIIAGRMAVETSVDPDNPNPTRQSDPSGWYVVCNGRIVLAADTSRTTGWGDLTPKWHPQYSGFGGFLIFNSKDPEKLPMTTTKRNVDTGSEIFRRALTRTALPTKAWIKYTGDRKANLEDSREKDGSLESQEVYDVQPRRDIVVPRRPPSSRPMANINYAVRRDYVRELAEAFGDSSMSYRDVGLTAFSYAYDDLVN